MTDVDITPLESSALAASQDAHPLLETARLLRLISRENTGVGRFTTWAWSGPAHREVLAPPLLIMMDGLTEYGIGILLFLEPTELSLELIAYGGVGWDGVERPFSIEAQL